MGGREIEDGGVFGDGTFGADGVQMANEVEELVGFGVVVGLDFGVVLRRDFDAFEGVFFKEEFELGPIVISSVLVVGVFEGMHGDFSGFISGNDLTY